MGNRDGISVVILAGGQSRRLGQDKAVADFGGEPLLRRVIRRAVAGLASGGGNGLASGGGNGLASGGGDGLASGDGDSAVDVVVAVSDARRAAALPLAPEYRIAIDPCPGGGALAGICAGLAAAGADWALVVACDLPFLSPPLLRYLAGQRRQADIDAVAAVVPLIGGRPEPTHALYSRRCLPAIRARLAAGQLKAAGFLDDVAVRYLDEAELRRHDPQLLSFYNINYPGDLARARELARAPAG